MTNLKPSSSKKNRKPGDPGSQRRKKYRNAPSKEGSGLTASNGRQKSQRAQIEIQSKAREKNSIAGRLISLLKRCVSAPVEAIAEPITAVNANKRKRPQSLPTQKKRPQESPPPVHDEPKFVPPPRTEPRRIVVSSETLETRVALMTGKRLDEYQIERAGTASNSNAIYLGRICNHEPSLEAAFVDIGEEKNAFLHFRDMLSVTQDLEERVTLDPGVKNQKRDFNVKLAERLHKLKELQAQNGTTSESICNRRHPGRIPLSEAPKLFPPKSEVLVQVSKAPIGTKGARVTTNISIPGRYLVLLPYSDDVCISKKIDDRKERARLREILSHFDLPKGLGLICRTVGEGRRREHFENDLNMLLEIWQNIQTQINGKKPPICVYSEPSLLERTIRDFLTEDIDEIIVDNPDVYKNILTRLKSLVGEKTKLRVKLFNKPGSVFDAYGVSKQISLIFTHEVPLKSGGYLCIEETEALVAIDVNSGKSRSGKSLPETIFSTNLEAAEEVARQLRLRNIGGQVVIDFIDMGDEKQRRELLAAMKSFCAQDRVKTEIAPISRFGLMEMTRRREQESILHAVYDPCPYCHGRGKIRSVMSMSIEIHRRLLEILQRHASSEGIALRVLMHPAVLARMKKEDTIIIDDLEKKYRCSLSFRPDEELHLEAFKIVNPVTLKEFE